MCYLLARQPRPFVRAVAPVAGTMMESWGHDLRPAARISILAVQAWDDDTTLWDGDLANRDGWGPYYGTEAVIGLRVQGLALGQASDEQISGNVRLRRWSTPADATGVLLYELASGGHAWPHTLGHDDAGAAAEIIRFFLANRPRGR